MALHHARRPFSHSCAQGWALPASLAAVRKYIDTFEQRPSWKATYYSPELVIAGWERHGVKKQA